MPIPLRLLLLEDNPSDAELVLHTLRRAGYDPVGDRVETEQDYRDHLHPAPDIILADFSMPEFDSLRALEIVKERRLDIPFIIVSGTIGEEHAVQVMRLGAADYIIKDRLGRLGLAVSQALEKKLARNEARLAERRLCAQHTTTKALAGSPHLASAIPTILESVAHSLDCDRAVFWVVDPKAERLVSTHSWPSPDATTARPETTCPRGEGLPGRVWAVGGPLWVADESSGEQLAPLGAVAFPILLGREVVGVMEFFGRHIDQPDEHILGMMTAIGSQIGQYVETKRVEEGLRLFRALLDQTTDGIEVIDLETGRFIDVNGRTCIAHGYSRKEYLSLSVSDVDPDIVSHPWKDLIEGRRKADSRTFEGRHRRKDGSTFPVEISLNFIPLDREYLVAVVRDTTERKQLEDQFRQAQKMEAFGQLAGGVAHDFNNLLTIISGYGEMMLASLRADDPNRWMIEAVLKAGDRAAQLTRQLLAFSRKQVVQPQILDLNAVVAGTDKMLARLIGEDVNLTTVLPPALAGVKADPGQVEQVIVNLVVNARDAMPRGGRITIETANVVLDTSYAQARDKVEPGRYVRLAVSDTGDGMTEEVKQHIFEPFFTTKEVGKGTGLGLATVFGIVKQSGGHVGVASEVGRGTTFEIYLPAVEDAPPPEKSMEGPTATLTGTETVLLVEDESAVREMTRKALQVNGYTVLEAADGAEAIRLCDRHEGPIDLVVSDVVMPRMGGRELAERLTALRPETRVLFVSGHTDDAVVRQGILQAEVAFLQKPFSMDALRLKVRTVLDQ
jgi:PAS domain S-box-containing protein